MIANRIRRELISALEKIVQRKTDEPFEIDDRTDPHKNLGIESVEGVELACHLAGRLGIVIPDDQNPVYDDSRHDWRTVGEIVEFLGNCEHAKTLADVQQ